MKHAVSPQYLFPAYTWSKFWGKNTLILSTFQRITSVDYKFSNRKHFQSISTHVQGQIIEKLCADSSCMPVDHICGAWVLQQNPVLIFRLFSSCRKLKSTVFEFVQWFSVCTRFCANWLAGLSSDGDMRTAWWSWAYCVLWRKESRQVQKLPVCCTCSSF
jgi:hypothetical protein